MKLKVRRVSVVACAFLATLVWILVNPASYEEIFTQAEESESGETLDFSAEAVSQAKEDDKKAVDVLRELEVKGRAPKTGYSREEFYHGWPNVDGCSLRQKIIKREFGDTAVLDGCYVVKGEFDEPYTGEHQVFKDKTDIAKIQIDHVVALSDAWQKGAQNLTKEKRYEIATDPLNLIAVDGKANQKKSDGDAATWLPTNKKFRCQYVARQISVKYKYKLWVSEAEKTAIEKVLENCPNEPALGL